MDKLWPNIEKWGLFTFLFGKVSTDSYLSVFVSKSVAGDHFCGRWGQMYDVPTTIHYTAC